MWRQFITRGTKLPLRYPAIFILASVVLASAITVLGGYALFEMRRDAMDRAADSASSLAQILEHDIARNLEIYETSMQAVISGVADRRIMALPPNLRQQVLFDRSTTASHMGSLLVTDAQGNLILDSCATPARKVNIADRDYFRVHHDEKDIPTYISQPFRPRLSDGGQSIALSKRLDTPDGKFAGIVAGTLRLSYFSQLFEGANIGPKGTLSLLRTDGLVLMRQPYDKSAIGTVINDKRAMLYIGQVEKGALITRGAFDGVERLYTFHKITGYPLVVSVALATDDIYASWRRRAIVFGAMIGFLNLTIIVISVLFARQLQLRLAAEKRLEMLSVTDPLTGLGNRRHLDRSAELEWRRARREKEPLSLLMVDVDYFKQYNDRYGHAAGDSVLREVAACIRHTVSRGTDLVARYGGEEFTVLLPNTTMAGAVSVAHSIRQAVCKLAIPHERSPLRQVTVSIGAATVLPVADRQSELGALFSAGDAALYSAKAAGRNAVIQA